MEAMSDDQLEKLGQIKNSIADVHSDPEAGQGQKPGK
tara:strand:- start:938 stop:1048 length:111 start_codon:yes stop_codon:yes gene_type:complete